MCPKMQLGCYLTESKNMNVLVVIIFYCLPSPVLVTRTFSSVLYLNAELGMLKCTGCIDSIYCVRDVRTVWRGLICNLFRSEERCVLK